MRALLFQRWFLLALVAVLAGGIFCSRPLRPIAEAAWLRDGVVALVMFCLALSLPVQVIVRSLRTPVATLLAVAVTYGALPLVAWALSWLLRGDLAPGLQVVAATPCTLASAAVLTRRAGGNEAVATLVTVITNASCFLVTPLWLRAMTGTGVDASPWSLGAVSRQLAILVVLPMAAAQVARGFRAVAAWAAKRRAALDVVAQCGVLSMTLLGAIRTGMRLDEQDAAVAGVDIAAMLFIVLLLHLSMFGLGWTLGRVCRCSRPDQISIAIAGSQKTLVVGVLMAITLKASILPMVAYHCLQLIVDTLIADAVRGRGSGSSVWDEQANSNASTNGR
jgi:sodium/bile acid cotransporter 7